MKRSSAIPRGRRYKKGSRTIAVEIKSSTSPQLTKGTWNSLEELAPEKAYVIAPVKESYPLSGDVSVISLNLFLERML